MQELVHGEYHMDMASVPGLAYVQEAPGLRSGFEFETGWHDFDERDAFFKDIELAGLANRLVSKYDSSIKAKFAAELVSVPQSLGDTVALMAALGTVAEKHAAAMTLQGCGVHIHLTKKALNDFMLWRLIQALTCGPTQMARWAGALKFNPEGGWQPLTKLSADKQTEFETAAFHINQFWSLVSLRHETAHSGRHSWDNVDGFRKHPAGDHKRAVITAAKTPTVEIRLFRSARSATVLASYPEAILALIDFIKQSKSPLIGSTDQGWPGGAFPVDAYAAFVKMRPSTYPALAKRLGLAKFQEWFGGAASYQYAEHINDSHYEIQRGCLIENDTVQRTGKGRPVLVVQATPSTDPDEPIYAREVFTRGAKENVLGSAHTVQKLNVIHACKGAELGVFE